MSRLPNGNLAVVDIRKLEDYCLNPHHWRGRHKARVFWSTLALGRADALWLRDALLKAVKEEEAAELETDQFGTRWIVDAPLSRQGRSAVVRTVWIVPADEQIPRLVTCWVT
jgi:hypothetical protein